MRVFSNALRACVVNADNDQRLDLIVQNQFFRNSIYTPLVMIERSRGIKKILAIVQIEHQDIAGIAQNRSPAVDRR